MEYMEMFSRVKAHLSADLDCSPADLERCGTLFVENRKQAFPFLKMAAIGEAVIVSASPELLAQVRTCLADRSRDEIFEFPLTYGQSIYYLPDRKAFRPLPLRDGFTCELLEGKELSGLRGLAGFENSLAFDENGNTPTRIAFLARKGGEIAGLAGASDEMGDMWEMGVDVRPEFRRQGLAASLVSQLTAAILEKDMVPFYCASVTNIGSQAAAHRSGLAPCWTATYGNVLDSGFAYRELGDRLAQAAVGQAVQGRMAKG